MPKLERATIKSKAKMKELFVMDWRDTLIAIVLLALIFAYDYKNPLSTPLYLPQALIAVAVVLLVNKIAHKLLAKRFGCTAYYKLWMPGVVFGLLLMLTGLKFPVIGAVVVAPFAFARWGFKSRRLSMTEEGLMGLVGPGANILLAIFLRCFPGLMLSYMSFVSAYFAIFNLIPMKPLDGSKILFWKPLFWLFLVIINILLFFI